MDMESQPVLMILYVSLVARRVMSTVLTNAIKSLIAIIMGMIILHPLFGLIFVEV